MKQFLAGERYVLDPVGQYYASIISPEYPGNYTIAVHLKEKIN